MYNHLLKFGFLFGETIDDEKIQNHLKRLGYRYRIIENDGESYTGTMDFDSNRLNIRLRHNKIIGF